MRHVGRQMLIGLWGLLLVESSHGVAGPPTATEFLESPPLVRVEVSNAARLLNHPRIQGFVKRIATTAEFRHQWNRPEADPIQQVLAYAERVTGETGTAGLAELLSGRLSLAVAGPKQYVWLYELSDSTYRERLSSELAALGVRKTETPDIRKLGSMSVGLIDRWLVGSEDRSTVALALEKLKSSPPARNDDAPILNLWLDWKTLNSLNKKPDRLQLPVKDAGQLIVFGNWLGLLVGTDELTVHVTEKDHKLQIEVLGDGNADAPASLFGSGAKLAPLLNGPGTLWSVSGLRDWSGLWQDREELMTPQVIAAAEKANEQIAQQFKALRSQFYPIELAETLGPQFRWAIARQQNLDYHIDENNSLPAAVLTVSLRDAKRFREITAGPLRAVSFIAAFGEAKMRSVAEDYQGVKISSLAFRDDAVSVKNFDQRLFNLRPAWATTDDHFILGSTTEIVRNTLDEINSTAAESPNTNVIAAQAGSFAELAAALRDYRRTIVDETVLNNGIAPDTANSDFDIVADAIKTLGNLQGQLERTPHGFHYTLTWMTENP